MVYYQLNLSVWYPCSTIWLCILCSIESGFRKSSRRRRRAIKRINFKLTRGYFELFLNHKIKLNSFKDYKPK